jgi:non-heme Fe2+,alpha-ketoglutarate-dependent halogenase
MARRGTIQESTSAVIDDRRNNVYHTIAAGKRRSASLRLNSPNVPANLHHGKVCPSIPDFLELLPVPILDAFLADGFAAPVRVLAPEVAARYATRLRVFLAAQQDHPEFRNWTYVKSHLALAWVADLAAESSVLDVVEEILGPNLLLWDSFVPAKRPRSIGHFGWHQDGTYWSIAPLDEIVTVWVALEAVVESNGAMKMIPGSHRWGQVEHVKTFDPTSLLRRGQRITRNVDESAARTITLNPGEASLHGAFVVHGSGGNASDDWRLGVALTYVSDRVGPRPDHVESGILLRGSATHGMLDAERLACVDLGEREIREYQRVTTRSAKRYADVTGPNTDRTIDTQK